MTVKISEMFDTFANVSVVYDAIMMDVTDTESAANSTLLNLKVGGSPMFVANKNGDVYSNTITTNNVSTNTVNATSIDAASVNVVTITCNSITTNTILLPAFGGTLTYPTFTGMPGQVAWDSGYIYLCVATDTWKRVAILT